MYHIFKHNSSEVLINRFLVDDLDLFWLLYYVMLLPRILIIHKILYERSWNYCMPVLQWHN